MMDDCQIEISGIYQEYIDVNSECIKNDNQSEMPIVLETESKCTYIQCSSDGSLILSGETNGLITLWDAKTFNKIQIFKGHTSQVISIAISINNDHFVSCGRDDEIKVWSIVLNQQICYLGNNSRQRSKVSFTPNGKHIIYVTADKQIKAWSSQTFKRSWSLIAGKWNNMMSCSPDGRQIILGDSMRGQVRMWNIQRKKRIRNFNRHSRCCIVWMSYSPNGQCIAFSSGYCNLWLDPQQSTQIYLMIWDCQTGSNTQNLYSPSNDEFEEAPATVFYPNLNVLISGGQDQQLYIWSLKNGKQILKMSHPGEVTQLIISPDGKFIFSMLNKGILIIKTPLLELNESGSPTI